MTNPKKYELYKNAIREALLEDGAMNTELYHRDLESEIPYLRRSLKKDMEDYLFGLVCDLLPDATQYQIAMILIEKKDRQLWVNEAARERLKQLWVGENYVKNIEQFLPSIVSDLMSAKWSLFGTSVVNQRKSRAVKGFGS